MKAINILVLLGSVIILIQTENVLAQTGNFSTLNVSGRININGTYSYIEAVGSDDRDLRFRTEDDVSFIVTSGANANFFYGLEGRTSAFFVDASRQNAGIGTNSPLGNLDVRGDNLILTRPDVTSSTLISNRFAALGESGGRQGAVNGCDLYGFRSQINVNNFVNLGVTSGSRPTLSWGTTLSDNRLDLRLDESTTSCGTLVAQFGTGTYELIVYGSSLASGGSWVTSDKRFKNNIKKIDNALGLVRQIEGDTYEYNQENEAGRTMPEGKSMGFVAQELAKILPDAVMKDEEGFYAVNYDAIIPLLVEAVKELDGQVQTTRDLQREVEDLRTELKELKGIKGLGTVQLFQNAPNPFNIDTRITYQLPTETQQSVLYIYDMQGKQVAVYNNLESGQGEVLIEGRKLEAGMYLYTLVADGKEVDTKRMIMTQ